MKMNELIKILISNSSVYYGQYIFNSIDNNSFTFLLLSKTKFKIYNLFNFKFSKIFNFIITIY